jgi:hypothetical protein
VDNTGLVTEKCDFFSARRDDEEGWIRTGVFVDFEMQTSLPPGRYEIGRMIFKPSTGMIDPNDPLQLTEAELNYQSHSFRAEIGDGSGGVMSSGRSASPDALFLSQGFPNPSTSQMNMAYGVSERAEVRIGVYDLSGRLVRALVNDVVTPGIYKLVWLGDDSQGRPLPSGTYFIRMESEDFKSTRKVVLMR